MESLRKRARVEFTSVDESTKKQSELGGYSQGSPQTPDISESTRERIGSDSQESPKRTHSSEFTESQSTGTNSSTLSTETAIESDNFKNSQSPESQGNSSSAENSGVPSSIPQKFRSWEKETLEDLNIKVCFQPDVTPFEFVTRKVSWGELDIALSVYEVEEIKKREKSQKKKIACLTEHVLRSQFLDMIKNLNYSTFSDFNMNTLDKLNSYVDHSFVPKDLPDDVKDWFYRFHVHGKSFVYVLSRMVENVVNGEQNLECHFQHLFDTFVKMFGMHSETSFEPCLRPQKFEIGPMVEVKGAPDIVYAHHRFKHGERKPEKPRVVVVCEVEKDQPVLMEGNYSTPSKTRGKIGMKYVNEVSSTSSSSAGTKTAPILQIHDRLIGQHCGKLLLKFSESIGHSSIFGIVVQETHVTFTVLSMTNSQYRRIKDGRLKHGDGERATFTYTRPFDYFKKEDLEKILEPFIKFGLDQGL